MQIRNYGIQQKNEYLISVSFSDNPYILLKQFEYHCQSMNILRCTAISYMRSHYINSNIFYKTIESFSNFKSLIKSETHKAFDWPPHIVKNQQCWIWYKKTSKLAHNRFSSKINTTFLIILMCYRNRSSTTIYCSIFLVKSFLISFTHLCKIARH